jgi:hypothetical protein
MMIAGTAFKFLPYAQPVINPAIQWIRDSAGYPNGSDRGAAQDIYEARLRFEGPEATMDSLESVLQSNREGLTLSSFSTTGQEIFGPEVSYVGSISAAIVEYGRRVHTTLNRVSGLDLTIRALSPTLLGTTPSLASLRLQEGWEGGQDWDVGKAFSMTQVAAYADHRGDTGMFVGTFQQKPAEARAILAYLLTTARASTITLPTFSGVTYPFGQPRGAGPFNAKITAFDVRRKDLNRWIFRLTFEETA